MMTSVRRVKIEKIIVTRLHRLTRSLPTLRKTIVELFGNGELEHYFSGFSWPSTDLELEDESIIAQWGKVLWLLRKLCNR